MHPIIYDVAVSLDGFISGPSGDISQFAHDGPVVQDYQARLATYATAIMGRRTYEFGYAFGLVPGQNPYPDMETHVFSETLTAGDDSDITINSVNEAAIKELKAQASGPIYLCGGGTFAGWLLERNLIDRIILKRAPVMYGQGVSLFGQNNVSVTVKNAAATTYSKGYILEDYTL